MATFTFAAVPTTTKIDIASGTGDWDDLYTDVLAEVGDESVMSRAGSGTSGDPHIYTVVGTNCEVELSGTVDLTVASYQEVDWGVASADGNGLDIQANATFRMESDSRIDLTSSGANERRIECFGQMLCRGSSGIFNWCSGRLYDAEQCAGCGSGGSDSGCHQIPQGVCQRGTTRQFQSKGVE